jgi:hypothetical protein
MKISIILALIVISFAAKNTAPKHNYLLDPNCDQTKIPAGQVSWEKVPYLDIKNR